MPKSPDALKSGASKASSSRASTPRGSSVGASQNSVIKLEVLTFADFAEFRAHSLLADGTVFSVKDHGQWMYRSDLGAGVADDADAGGAVLKPTAIDTSAAGRAYPSGTISVLTPAGTFAASSIVESLAKAPSVSSGALSIPRALDGQWFSDLSVPPSAAYDARSGVTATGSDVDSWTDLSGCGATATQTGSNRPTIALTSWGDGGPCLNFAAASSQNLRCNGVASKLALGQARSVMAYVKPSATPGASASVFSSMNGSNVFNAYGAYGTVYALINSGAIVNSAVTASAVYTASRQTLVVYCQSDGAGNSHVYCDGRQLTIANDAMDATVALATQAAIGGTLYSGGITNMFDGSMRYVSVHNGILAGDDYKHACRQLMGGLYTRVVCDGNSLTAVGWGIYPATLQTILGARNLGRFEVTNTAVGGQDIDDMISRYAAQVAPAYSAYQANVLVAWELSNQFVGSYSGSLSIAVQARTAVDKLWEYCATARATGWKIIVLTATYREAAGYVGLPSKAVGDSGIDAMNTLVRAEWRDHADDLVDICADPYFQNSALTHVFDDGTHMSDPASQVVAVKVARAVNRITATL